MYYILIQVGVLYKKNAMLRGTINKYFMMKAEYTIKIIINI